MAYHSNGGYSGDEHESRSGGDDRPDSDLSDKPIYLLEHLATFTVNKDTGIVYPADGMRRLLQLEKTTGIWSQKMQLCLDNQWVLIMDYETGNIIERFPASLIQEPTAFTSNNPMEMYNNILVFIVAGDSGSRSEMHIFQSQSISAVHLVEDLKQLRNGKNIVQNREKTIPPPPMKTSIQSSAMISHRESYGGGNIIRGNNSNNHRIIDHIDNYNNHNHHHHHHNNDTDSDIGGPINQSNNLSNNINLINNDETSSISSDKYERDVTVLNHCFDDIEKFIARLQHAAAATRELERRRRNRKSKKKDPGEGLLTLRTRPPHEKEFIDIFAKFKLSFNLLAKLKQHIHDPNAPELVHFLFTPLALIVEACSDTYYESYLPSHVLNPLLTRDAINLLINCVTSKETELWRSLGDPWIIPKDQWKGHIGNYHPVFFDGWSPDYPVVDELENQTTTTTPTGTTPATIPATAIQQSTSNPKRIDTQQQQQHHHHHGGIGVNRNLISGGGNGCNIDIIDRGGQTTPIASSSAIGDYDYDGPLTHHHHHHQHAALINDSGDRLVGERTGFRDFSTRSDISIDSIERNGLSGINTITPNSGGGGGVSVGNNSSIAIQSLVGGIQNLGTNQLQNSTGHNRVGNIDEQDIELWLDKLQSRGAKIVQVTYPRTANNDKELTVIRGEHLEILDDSRKWWKARNSRGQTAHVPHTIVTPYNYADNSDVFNNPLYTQHQQSHNYNKIRQNESESAIGGPQHQQQLNSTEWIRNKHIDDRYSSVGSSRNLINDNYINYNNKNKLEQQQQEQQQQQQQQHQHQQEQKLNNKFIVPPPPPPPPVKSILNHTLPRTTSINNHSNNSTLKSITNNNNSDGTINNYDLNNGISNSSSNNSTICTTTGGDDMQEELKRVLTLFREKRRNIDIIKTPEIYIQQTSKPYEIDKWLKGKGFSQNVIKKLHGLNGNELFALKRNDLEKLCGLDEGKRLASQITIQRNVSGYKTARTSELQAILARAREKSEQQYQQ